MKIMVIDTSNILFRVHAQNAKLGGSAEEKAGLALHSSIQGVNRYFKMYKPDTLVFAFEGLNNWRKGYTMSDKAITTQVYKANRPRDASIEPFIELIKTFKSVMEQYSSVICASHDEVEADDIIAGIVQKYANEKNEIIIISSDKDFIQLLDYPNVKLVDPATGNQRECDDVEYFKFLKCIRGDSGDHVRSAYPRVRETEILKAYNDEYERINFMNEEWVDKITGNTYRVGDLFEENKKLMILDQQPEDVRRRMFESIEYLFDNPGKYDNFNFMKFLGKYQLVNIAETIQQYEDMLSANSHSWRAAQLNNEKFETIEDMKTNHLEF